MNEDINKQKQELWQKIQNIRFCMLTTLTQDGRLHSRPMTLQQAEFDGSLWFFTSCDTTAAEEIKSEQQVNIAYADIENNTYISLSGIAQVSHDMDKINKLWHPACKAWFPKGLEDPELRLLEVDIYNAEYWDSPSSKMVQLYSIAKAIVTGTSAYDLGDHVKLDSIKN